MTTRILKRIMITTNKLLPCPMCGSPAEIDSTGALECYGYAWQTTTVECTKTLDPYCGMELSLMCDPWYTGDKSYEILIDSWNRMRRDK